MNRLSAAVLELMMFIAVSLTWLALVFGLLALKVYIALWILRSVGVL